MNDDILDMITLYHKKGRLFAMRFQKKANFNIMDKIKKNLPSILWKELKTMRKKKRSTSKENSSILFME